ncbi:MAG: hypothetical protein ACRD50_11965 [Candidatus Acidiferrales bacterium]
MVSTLLLVLAAWILLSIILVLPLARMMHIASGESAESPLKGNDPASKDQLSLQYSAGYAGTFPHSKGKVGWFE